MAAILAVPGAMAKHTDPVPLPWNPEMGKYQGSYYDWEEYLQFYDRSTCRGWSWYSNSFRSVPSSTGSTSNPRMTPQNSYLFLPPMNLTAGECYQIEFRASSDEDRCTGGRFEIRLATDRTQAGADAGQLIIDTPVGKGTGDGLARVYEYFNIYFTPEKTGVQSLVFKCTSPQGAGNLCIRDVNKNLYVRASHVSLPKAVTNLTATADPDGRKEATISFTAPTKTVVGTDITDLDFINVYVDGVLAGKVENPVPGQDYQVTVKSTVNTAANVVVKGGNSHGEGESASIECHIGNKLVQADRVEMRQLGKGYWYEYKARAIFANDQATITWKPVTGENVTYTVVRNDGKVIATDTAELTASDPEVKANFPATFQYTVTATVDGTAQTPIYSNVISINNEVPYNLTFESEEGTYEMNWENTQGYPFTFGVGEKVMSSGYGSVEGEWLITPSVKLDPAKYYKIVMSTSNWLRPVHFQVYGGKSNTSAAMDQTFFEEFLETQDVEGGTPHSGFFRVQEAGTYFLGVKAWTDDDDPNNLTVHSISVIEVSSQLPAAAENLAVKFDSEDPTKAKLNFNVPSKSIANENLSKVDRVDVYKDNVLLTSIENPVPGTAESLDIEAKLGEQIVYKIVPVNDGVEGVAIELPVCILIAPYEQEFNNGRALVGYTIVDLQQNGFSWGAHNGCVRAYASGGAVNDWLITPPVHLEGGHFYKAQYVTCLETDDTEWQSNSTVGLYVGTEATPEAMTRQVVPSYDPHGGYTNAALVKDYFYIEETGEYYFGWLAQGNTTIAIDNFTLSDKIKPGVPDKARDLTIKPDRMGGLSGVISFTTPEKTLKGDPLYGNIEYTVYRDGEAVYTTTSTPNKQVSFTDKGMEEGIHLYTVYPTNESGLGREAEDVAFFGVNRPSYPENFQVRETDTYGTVLMTWDAPSTDYDGFEINPDLITYDLFIYDMEEGKELPVANGLKTLSYTHKAKNATDPQAFIRYGIRARTTKGGSQGFLAKFVNVGAPYTLPVKESFTNYKPNMAFLQEGVEGYAAWGYNSTDNVGVENFDGDNGMALMEVMFQGSSARLFSGKVAIDGENPYMTLYLYNNANGGPDYNTFAVEYGRPGNWTVLDEKSIHEWTNGVEGWQKVRIDLNSLKGQTVQFGFRACALSYTFTHFDNLIISCDGNDDLTVAKVSAPYRVNPGQKFDITADVKNNGLNEADLYTVRLYRDKTLLETQTGKNIQPGGMLTYGFSDTLSEDAQDETHTYSVDVRYATDIDLSDNRRDNIKVNVRPADILPMVENLTAVPVNEREVELAWEAPELSKEAIETVDDMENYEAWTGVGSYIGDYLNIDADKLEITSMPSVQNLFPKYGSKQAWFIMDTDRKEYQELNEGANFSLFDSHSGHQCIAAASLSNRELASNDWLILPELCGKAQTISFWARSSNPNYKDAFRVLSSSNSAAFGDFEEIERQVGVPTEWTEFTYNVPEGTKYFAIRHQEVGGLYLMVDDIKFTPAGQERLSLEGFKVTHNEDAPANVDAATLKYNHKDLADGDHTYRVAVNYNMGVSRAAETYVKNVGLDQLYAGRQAVYGMKGFMLVVGSEGKTVNAYAADGTNVFSGEGNGRYPMNPGVYVVTVGNKSYKVLVK